VDVFQKTVFCGVLRCFVVFCGVLCVRVFLAAFFTKQHKIDHKVYKTLETNKIQNTLCAIQHNTVLCIFLSLRKCLQKIFAQHVQNIAKHPQNTAKHCFSENTRKTPQNTRKTPTKHSAKHHKTPQNTFANKTDRIS